jgi:ribosomal protein L11 methyltransferase
MAWSEVCICVPRQAAKATEQALEDLGSLAITLEDDADNPVLEPGPGETPLWPSLVVRGLFESGINRSSILSGLAHIPGADRPGVIQWREVDDRDWERAWMDRFTPMCFGKSLWIVPSGMEAPVDPAAIAISLDPGLAFGTGTHPTTALCLEWLDGVDCDQKKVVDYGCGSGVLGIAAALKGARGVDCVDNDPQALEATAMNAMRNAVEGRIHCSLPQDFECSAADIVLANILAGPLVELSDTLADTLRPGGMLLMSGVLSDQVTSVTAAYEGRAKLLEVSEQEGWARILMEKMA